MPPPTPSTVPTASATFSIVILTAPPAGQLSEAGGAMLRVDGKEVLLRAIELFVNRDNVKQILVVFEPEELDNAKKRFGSHFAFTGIKLASGGPKWLDQASAALEKLAPDTTHVILHDAARCCVPYGDIDALMEAAASAPPTVPAVGLTTPLRTTLLELDDTGAPLAYHLPNHYVQLVTPQAFTRAAYEQMAKTKQEVHASAIRIVKGSPLNIRMGLPADEKLVKTMMSILPRPQKKPDGPFNEAQR